MTRKNLDDVWKRISNVMGSLLFVGMCCCELSLITAVLLGMLVSIVVVAAERHLLFDPAVQFRRTLVPETNVMCYDWTDFEGILESNIQGDGVVVVCRHVLL